MSTRPNLLIEFNFQVITQEVQRDKIMNDLLRAMDNLYGFMVEALRPPRVDEVRGKLLRDMSLQTIQCAYFIRDQVQMKSLCKYLSRYLQRHTNAFVE